jgi:hypothetical protein
LIDHFLLKHMKSTTYYPQGNGQVESINKVFGTPLTKLVSENIIDWEHLSMVLFSYRTTYTISINLWITSIDSHKIHNGSC